MTYNVVTVCLMELFTHLLSLISNLSAGVDPSCDTTNQQLLMTWSVFVPLDRHFKNPLDMPILPNILSLLLLSLL